MNDKKDLTRIQDLSEYLHEEDQELDDSFAEENQEDVQEVEQLEELNEEQAEEEEYVFEEAQVTEDDEENESEDEADEVSSSFQFEESQSFEIDDDKSDQAINDHEITSETEDFNEADNFPEEEFLNSELVHNENETEPIVSPEELFINEATDHITPSEFSEHIVPTQTETDILGQKFSSTQQSLTTTTVENDLSNIEDTLSHKEGASLTSEIKHFAENYSYDVVKSSGNPAFSIVASQVPKKYQQDVLRYIKEYKITGDISLYEETLRDGTVLISHISEYTAILLANRLSRLGAHVKLAPSSVLHSSPNYDNDTAQNVNRNNFISEVSDELALSSANDNHEIIITTTSFLQGYKIHKYLGVAQDFIVLSSSDLSDILKAKEVANKEIDTTVDQDFFNSKLLIHEFHDKLKSNLELQAKKVNGNAIIGLEYKYINPGKNTYEISCTGTIVYTVKLDDGKFL